MKIEPGEEQSHALSLLTLCELFADLDAAGSEDLAGHVEVVRLGSGELLMTQGEPADCMYTVVSGRLHVFVQRDDGRVRFLNEIGLGQTVGELALIDQETRSATVRAARDCVLVKVGKAGFERYLRRHPAAFRTVAHLLAGRMRKMMRREDPQIPLRTIVVIGAGDAAPPAEFIGRLCASLRAFGEVLHLNRTEFEKLYGDTPEFDPGIGAPAWLSELEDHYRFIVWEAELEASPWTMQCVRRADRILAVGRAGSAPTFSSVENAILEERRRRHLAPVELVLVHEETSAVFAGTSDWLDQREVLRHHHARASRPGDIDRLARILAGKAIGLAMGGGGARGFAHLGVIRAVEEAGIPVDAVGGVSMGAIVAGLYAMGHDWQTILHLMRTEMADKHLKRDLTLPFVSLSSGRKLRRAFQAFFGGTAVEDLWIQYFCVSCNLTTSEMVVHQRGPLRRAVTASNSLPGILPPVIENGQLLVDGGILNNHPGDVLKEIFGGAVIVSSVSPRKEVSVDASFTEMPSPWRLLWNRLNPLAKSISVPSIPAMMMRTLMVASNQQSREMERQADFYLRPPVDRFRLDEWTRIEEIAEVGYEYTKTEIAAWIADGRIAVGKLPS